MSEFEYFHIITADEYAVAQRNSLIARYDTAVRHRAEYPKTSKMIPPVSESQRETLPDINTMEGLANLGCPYDFACAITGKKWPEIKQLLVIDTGDYPLYVCFEVIKRLYEAMKNDQPERRP